MINGHGVKSQGTIKNHNMSQTGPDSFIAQRTELKNYPEESIEKSLKQRVKAVFVLTENNNPDTLDNWNKKENDGSQNHHGQDYLFNQRKHRSPPQVLKRLFRNFKLF
jgi:hypothetical protein